MLDIKFIIENTDQVRKSIEARNVEADLDGALKSYEALKRVKHELDNRRAESNRIAREISIIGVDEKAKLIERGKLIKSEIANLKADSDKFQAKFEVAMLTIPNILPEDTPKGFSDKDNISIRHHLEPKIFDFQPRNHLSLGTNLEILDFEKGAKIAGSGFYFLKNEGVLLEAALKRFAMDVASEHNFIMLQTPDIARNEFVQGVGFAPRGSESNTYIIEGYDLSLVATAEIPLAGLHAGEILDEDKLPIKYAAESHCFRLEAGAAGKRDKGLYRVHQFSKIELFQITTPNKSEETLEEILAIEEEIYQKLAIPYRVVRICAGDLGAPAYKKYDIEAWMPGRGEKGEYGEITSASNCTNYQARRLNIKYRSKNGDNSYVHTLNGTALALSRTPIAILENYQLEDGSILVPEVLQPYMGVQKIRRK